MKKFLIAALLSMLVIPVYAENCACDGKSIISKIQDATWFGGTATWDFAKAIYNVKDNSSFQSALKSYIEANCTVQNNKIQCK